MILSDPAWAFPIHKWFNKEPYNYRMFTCILSLLTYCDDDCALRKIGYTHYMNAEWKSGVEQLS
jgi:hypothetical protein